MALSSPNSNKLNKLLFNSSSSNVVEGLANKALILKIMKASQIYKKGMKNQLWEKMSRREKVSCRKDMSKSVSDVSSKQRNPN